MFYNGHLNDIECDKKAFFICEHEVPADIDNRDSGSKRKWTFLYNIKFVFIYLQRGFYFYKRGVIIFIISPDTCVIYSCFCIRKLKD